MSRVRKFIFIEVPKTGTSSIVAQLLNVDGALERNKVYLASGRTLSVPTHTTAAEITNMLGSEREKYTIIGFLRNPRDVLISKYYFYKCGRIKNLVQQRKATFGEIARHFSTKALPLEFWILLYPYKTSEYFILGPNGDLLLDRVGVYEDLANDFKCIFSAFGYKDEELSLPHLNISSRPSRESKLLEFISKVSLTGRRSTDVYWYNKVLSGRAGGGARGTSLKPRGGD